MDLTKSPNKIFVLSVVGVVVFLWVLVWLFGPQPEMIQPDIPLDTSLAVLLQGSKKVEEEEERVEEPIPDTWGRDPFALPYWTNRKPTSKRRSIRTRANRRQVAIQAFYHFDQWLQPTGCHQLPGLLGGRQDWWRKDL